MKKLNYLLQVGNINKIQSITESKVGKPISFLSLKDLSNNIDKYTYHDRIIKFDLNPDRADVIAHALKIFILTMSSVQVNKLFVPKAGLVDGMINEIFFENNASKLNP
ncbi:MAG: hypothetical protein ACJ0ON_02345 [Candidatus Marisimplicoccus sp.]